MIQNGNHEACTQLVEQNTAWIRSMAVQFEKQYSNSILSCDDYEQEGRIALRDAAWVRHRFGFDGEPCALAAAARDYGLSVSRARHIEKEALNHIRERLTKPGREKAAA